MLATEPVHCVVLHAVGMTISQISAISIDGSEQPGGWRLQNMWKIWCLPQRYTSALQQSYTL